MSKRIKNINKEYEEKIDALLGELGTVKAIVARYQEVTNELLPNTRGWYKKAIELTNAEVVNYNRTHRRNNEMIFKYKSLERPDGHPFN